MKRFGMKLMSSLLALVMVISLLPVSVFATDEGTATAEPVVTEDVTPTPSETPVVSEIPGSSETPAPSETPVPSETLDTSDSEEMMYAAMPVEESDPANGTCGEAISYALSNEGVLTLTGSGAMTDYASASAAPWYSVKDSVKVIVIGEGITTIGVNAFGECSSAATVTIPSTVTVIGDGAFALCMSVGEFVLPAGLKTIGAGAFTNCKALTKINLPAGLTGLGAAFAGCSELTEITIPAGITAIPTGAFMECYKLKTVTIAGNVTAIGSYAFNECRALTGFEIPATVTEIGMMAFSGCTALTEITIPAGVATLGASVFSGCSALRNVTIPKSVTTIADNAFGGCSALANVYYAGTVAEWDAMAISETGNTPLTSAAIHYLTEGHTHEYEKESVFANCERDGYDQYTCECGDSYKNNIVPAWGHSWDKGVVTKPASNTEAGEKLFTCSVCSATKTEEINLGAPVLQSLVNCESGVMLSWGAVAGADSYRVYRKTADGYWQMIDDTKDTYYIDATTASGVEYFYTVRCLDADGAMVSGYDSVGLSIKNLAAVPVTKLSNVTIGVQIAWEEAVDVAAYRVMLKSGTGWVALDDVTETEYVFNGAANGETYTFMIRGLDASGNIITNYENSAASILFVQAPVLKALSNDEAGIKFEWYAVEGAASYCVYRKTGSGYWQKIGVTTAASYIDTTAVAGTEYFYTVRCMNTNGDLVSGYDPIGMNFTIYDAPVISKVENTYGGITITWNTVEDISAYRVLVRRGTTWEVLGDTADTKFTYSGVESNTYYTFAVRCLNSAGEYVSYLTKDPQSILYIAAPELTSVSNLQNGVKILWNPVEGAAGYRVYRFSTGENAPAYWVSIGTTTANAFVDATAENGVKYYYTVRCLDVNGATVSGYDPVGMGVTRLTAPEISALENVDGAIKISWKALPDVAQYRLYMKVDDIWETVATTSGNEYYFNSVVSGSTYSFTLRCMDAYGNYLTGYDEIGKSITYYDAPVMSKMENVADGIKLTWNALDGVAQYRVFMQNGSSWEKVADTSAASYLYATSANGKSYTFTVRGMDAYGNYITGFDSYGWDIIFTEAPKLTDINNTDLGVEISWKAVDGAAGYRVYRMGKAYWTAVADVIGTSYLDTTTESGNQYSYTVRCIDSDGNLISGYNAAGISILCIGTPQINTIENKYNSIQMSWAAVEGVAGYRVYRKIDGAWEQLADVTTTGYTFNNPVNNTTYTFTIRCLDAYGNYMGGYSTEGKSIVYTAAPQLVKTSNEDAGIEVTWKAVEGAAGYRVYRKTSSYWIVIGDTINNKYVDTGAQGGGTYSYTVRCLDGAGNIISGYDPVGISITTVAVPEITALANTSTGVQVSWKAVSGAAKYCVMMYDGSKWESVAETASTSYIYTGAESGVTYTFAVRCMDAYGNYISNYDHVGKSIQCISAPVLVGATNKAEGVEISWEAVDGATGYRVFRKTSSYWSAVGSTTSTAFVDTTAKAGVRYSYTVRCIDKYGNYTSAYDTVGKSVVRVEIPSITALESNNSGIKVTWNKVVGASKYRLLVEQAGTWVTVGETSGTAYTYTKATSGNTYTFTILALDASGKALSNEYAATKSIVYIAAPKLIAAETGESGIVFSWEAVSGAAGYRVYRKTATSYWVVLSDTTSTSYVDANYKTGVKYTYTVRCIDEADKLVSGYDTNGKSITSYAAPVVTKLEGYSDGLRITWSAVSGAMKYRVFMKDGSDWVALCDSTSTTYTFKEAVSGTTYTIAVRALNSQGSYFTPYSAAPMTIVYTAVPKLLGVENAVSGAKVSWEAVDGAAKYRVYRKSGTSSWLSIGVTTGTTYIDTTVKNNVKYTYTVRCMDSAGTLTSGYNATGISYTNYAAPVIKKVESAYDGMKITWNASSGAVKYRVFLKTVEGWEALGDTNATSFTYTNAVPGKSYVFAVRSLDKDSVYISNYSASSVSTKYLSAPELLSVVNAAAGIQITWNAAADVAGYRVYRKIGNGYWFVIGDSETTSYVDKTAQGGLEYSYTVRGIDSKGNLITGYDPDGLSIFRS